MNAVTHRPAGLATLGLLAFSAIVVNGQLYAPLPLIPRLAGDFGVSVAEAGLVVTLFGVGIAFGQLCGGLLSDRFGRKPVMLLALLLVVGVEAAIWALPGFATLLALRFVGGLCVGAWAPAMLAYAQESFPPERRYFATGVISSGLILAGLIGQIYAMGVVGDTGPVALLWISAGLLVALVGLGTALVPAGPPVPAAGSGWGRLRGLPRLLTRPGLARAYLGSALSLMVFVSFYAAIELHLREAFAQEGMDTQWARWAGVPGMLLPVLAGRLIARLGTAGLFRLGYGVSAAGLALAALWPDPWAVTAAGAIYTAGLALTIPGLIAHAGMSAPDARASAIALHAFVQFLGLSLGPLLVALAPPGSFQPISALLVAACLAVLWVCRAVDGHGRSAP